MLHLIFLGFMFVGAIVAGLAAGKTVKRFFIGAGITLLCALPLLFIAVFKINMLKNVCVSKLGQRFDYSSISVGTKFIPGNLITAENIPSALIWILIGAFVLFAFFFYIATFNCRKNADNFYVGFGGTICAALVIYFCTVWGAYGLSTFIQIIQKYLDKFPTLSTIIATIILTGVILVVGTIFSFKSKRKGWEILSIQIGIFAGVYAVVWLLALAVAYPYGRYASNQAHKIGVTSNYLVYELPKEAQVEDDKIKYFLKKHRDFELPYSSSYYWTKDGSSNPYGKPIPPSKREYTLKYFNSTDFDEYCRSHEKLLKYTHSKNKSTLDLYVLNCTRGCARIYAGKAAIYRETNQPEKILPELMKTIWIDADLLDNSPFLIVELVRIAGRGIWYDAMVQLGPNAEEYAPVYREALNFMKSRKVHLPHEAGYFLHALSDDIYPPYVKKPGIYATFLGIPPKMSTAGKGILDSLSIRPKLKELENKEVFSATVKQPNGRLSNYRNAAIKSRTSIVVGTTALALKLYRVERGVYPNKIEQLVPEYLDKIPLCPVLGEPLKYESDGINFTFSYGEEKYRETYKLSSNPTY